jgi:hypothetical protein
MYNDYEFQLKIRSRIEPSNNPYPPLKSFNPNSKKNITKVLIC